ncbi:hypothetical protein BdWA1_003110 [Babesia duncani]|uniref:Uncharacterized protein n=1 Tax=Babesia duncani TaxID=323732 RepID=A0AAD9PIE8_9APIC|nr:hypothetical protein BdWA1_003110 [Babesia duncani]
MNGRKDIFEPREPFHIVAVLNECLVNFTPLEHIEAQLHDIIKSLVLQNVSQLTIYEANGRVLGRFSQRFKKKGVQFLVLYAIFKRENGSIELCLEPNANAAMSIYFINHMHARQIFDIPHPCLYEYTSKATQTINGTHDKRVQYQIPSSECITQPLVEDYACTIDKCRVRMPQVVIVCRLSLQGAICYILKWLLLDVALNPSGLYIKFSSLIGAICKNVASRLLGSVAIIYPFGKCGIPPWFLAESELYQFFDFGPLVFQEALETFNTTERKFGK